MNHNKGNMYTCPKHKIEMQVIDENVTVAGKKYFVKVASCPKCKNKYIGEAIFQGASIVTIGKTRYEYLSSLDHSQAKQEKTAVANKKEAKSIISKEAKNTKSKPDNYLKESKEFVKEINETKGEIKKKQKASAEDKELTLSKADIKKDKYGYYHAKHLISNHIHHKRCKNDNKKLIFVPRVIINYHGKEIRTSGYCCLRCDTLYSYNLSDFETHSNQTQDSTVIASSCIHKPMNLSVFIDGTNCLDFGHKNNILYICKGVIHCKNNDHKIESVTGVIANPSGLPIKINVNYCAQCGKYFIDYSEYSYYKRIYGNVMGNFRISSNGTWGDLFGTRSEESVLHLNGYTVNQTEDLSDDERRRTLEYLISHNIVEKAVIISHLDLLIRTNGKKHNMTLAVSRWTSDVEWVRNYQIDTQRHCTINQVKKNR